ncbi:TRAP transporter large permease [Citricoccus muralis]|uniref:TRAP transporter large permease n=1 Tax=Citricoccus muralis TaxID=169134 RepID=A0ABY8H6D2_9MICC|nr:TRAP transporter large permease [Citricoccus muralis]WFP16228.1 TRAP transporter large permease [Citricoccus muralis]
MSAGIAVVIVVVLLIGLLLTRMPVWVALGLSGAIGLVLLRDERFTSGMLASTAFEHTSTFSLTIIPMFILLGVFAVRARIAEQVFAIARRAFQRLPGGLGIATVAACAGFAAVSGSTIATTATMSRLSIGEMRKAGYSASLAGALVAVSGTLGAMIPPSLFLVLYAILTGESIAAMLAAGIIPGLLSAIAYSIYIMVQSRKQVTPANTASSKVPATVGGGSGELAGELDTTITNLQIRQDNQRLPLRGLFRLAVIFLIIMGGIYSGLFTPTESAAIAALFSLLILILEFRRDGARRIGHEIVEALKETAKTTSMVFAIIVGSALLSVFFVVARVPKTVTDAVTSLDVPNWIILALLLAFLIPLGTALESISIMVITVPLIYPAAMAMGFDGVWLGILIVKLIEIGMVTPPVGINCFVVAGTAKIRSSDVFRGIWPFVVIEILLVAVFFAFPSITLWLPSIVQ